MTRRAKTPRARTGANSERAVEVLVEAGEAREDCMDLLAVALDQAVRSLTPPWYVGKVPPWDTPTGRLARHAGPVDGPRAEVLAAIFRDLIDGSPDHGVEELTDICIRAGRILLERHRYGAQSGIRAVRGALFNRWED